MSIKIEISLTDFIGFVNKMGTAKQNHVKSIKEAIIKLHKKNSQKKHLTMYLLN